MSIISPARRKRRGRHEGRQLYFRPAIEQAALYFQERNQEKTAGVIQDVLNRLQDRNSINRGSLTEQEAYALDLYLRRNPVHSGSIDVSN